MRKTVVLALVALLTACGSAATGPATPRSSHPPPAGPHRLTSDGGVLYWVRDPNAYQYFWHPKAGDMVVTETFYTRHGPLGMPYAWNGRIVSLADGCVAANANSKKHPPTQCFVTWQDGQMRYMTTAETQSVDAFWAIMQKVPGAHW